MRFYIITLFLSFISYFAFSQQIKLKGQVSIHNSKYNTGAIEYVKDAYVTAPFSKADNTDDYGKFELEFVGIDAGATIKIQVEKSGFEVVNGYDLERVIIGRKLPLRIYLTTKGNLAIAQTELYNISKRALFKERDALIARLHASEAESRAAIAELEKRFDQVIANRFEAEELLNKKIEELQKRLPEFAQELAAQNLDYASSLFLEAYEYFKKGNIEKAIEVLDDSKLEQSYKEANENINEGKKLEILGKDLQEKGWLQIDQIITSYTLKAESFILLFKYNSATQLYEKVIQIFEINNFDKMKLASYYDKVGQLFLDNGQYGKSLEYNLKALEIKQAMLEAGHPFVASSYNSLALTYCALGQYDKSLEYNEKSLEINQAVLEANHPNVASSYNNIGLTYIYLNRYDKALEYSMKAIEIKKVVLDANDPALAISYCNIAPIYRILHEYEKALDYNQKALDIMQNVLDANHPNLAIPYNNMALIYDDLGQYEKALEYNLKALDIRKAVLDANHPYLANSYINIASTYNHLGKYEKALEYNLKAIEIRQALLDANHPALANSYNNIASTYFYLGQYEKALQYFQRTLEIKQAILPANHLDLAITWNFIGICYNNLKDYTKAIDAYEKAVNISPEIKDQNYYYLSIGITYLQSRQFKKAQDAFEKYQDLFPNDGQTYCNWAIYFALQGDKKQAIQNLQKAVKLGYNNLNWIQTDESMEELRHEKDYIEIVKNLKDQKK